MLQLIVVFLFFALSKHCNNLCIIDSMTLVKDEGLTVNLTEFEKLTVKTITPPLEDYLKTISKTGDTWYV